MNQLNQHKVDSVRMYLRLDVIDKLKQSDRLNGSLTQRINDVLLQFLETNESKNEERNSINKWHSDGGLQPNK